MSRSVFVDTSGVYAVFDRSDTNHPEAARVWNDLLDQAEAGDCSLVTHSGVVVESAALVQHRLGMDAARVLHDDVVPLLDVVWASADLHRRAVTALLAAGSRSVSLVDWMSFDVMRDHAIDDAFTFDSHFTERGFRPLVSPG